MKPETPAERAKRWEDARWTAKWREMGREMAAKLGLPNIRVTLCTPENAIPPDDWGNDSPPEVTGLPANATHSEPFPFPPDSLVDEVEQELHKQREWEANDFRYFNDHND